MNITGDKGSETEIISHFYRVQKLDLEKVVRIAAVIMVVYLLGFGLAEALFPIRPFWNDEWRLIYNIKFRSFEGLWGRLDLLQECPRVYLCSIKAIAAVFHYSYSALRLPPLLLTMMSVLFLFYLRKRIFATGGVLSYLFVLIVVSSQTFTDYMVQVKQYEMDILLSLLAIWQLLELRALAEGQHLSRGRYFLLCTSLLLAPFFSYTYPINAAPLFFVTGLSIRKNNQDHRKVKRLTLLLPLCLLASSILVFYFLDVRHMMADKDMYVSYKRAYYKHSEERFLFDLWNLFALVGSGFLFELVFGLLGIAAWLRACAILVARRFRWVTLREQLQAYAVALMVVILILFATGKLIGGVARLTAYSVPAIALLIVFSLDAAYRLPVAKKWVAAAQVVLLLALCGNIVSTCINTFTYKEYAQRIATYRHTRDALILARKKNVPFMFTDGVCGDTWNIKAPAPGSIRTQTIDAAQIAGKDTLCAEVIVRVNPGYQVQDTVPLYYMPDHRWIRNYVQQLPAGFGGAVAGDGLHYRFFVK